MTDLRSKAERIALNTVLTRKELADAIEAFGAEVRKEALEDAAKYLEDIAEGQRASFAIVRRSAEPWVSILLSAAPAIRALASQPKDKPDERW